MTPDLSVIVPVYNTMPYLTQCLASLTGQTIAPGRLQVVAVDDGSTDGSGAEIDRFEAEHPDMFEVIRQANSGGPANPCNEGLKVATGRYVFFLGSDDHLDPEAAERMVAAADEWESDVLCCRLVGVGGRWVNQSLFDETAPDVPFPSELLASALSNTKLFRRSLLEEHGIRFPEELRVGSDQPFTIEAMLHARRISVLADRPYYFAVKREGAENITYTSTWRARLKDLGAVVRRVAALLPEGEGRDAILQRHFSGEVATLLRRDFAEISAVTEQEELVTAVNDLAAGLLTDGVRARLRPLARLRYRLAAEGDLAGLRDLQGLEETRQLVRIDAQGVHQAPEGWAHRIAEPEFALPVDRCKGALNDVLETAELSLDGAILTGTASTTLTADSSVFLQVTLVNAGDRSSSGVRLQDAPDKAAPRSVPAEVVDGRLRWRMDLAELPRIRPGVVASLRLDVTTPQGRYRLPISTTDTPQSHFRRGENQLVARIFVDLRERALIEFERSN